MKIPLRFSIFSTFFFCAIGFRVNADDVTPPVAVSTSKEYVVYADVGLLEDFGDVIIQYTERLHQTLGIQKSQIQFQDGKYTKSFTDVIVLGQTNFSHDIRNQKTFYEKVRSKCNAESLLDGIIKNHVEKNGATVNVNKIIVIFLENLKINDIEKLKSLLAKGLYLIIITLESNVTTSNICDNLTNCNFLIINNWLSAIQRFKKYFKLSNELKYEYCTPWEPWSECTATCGTGIQWRIRKITEGPAQTQTQESNGNGITLCGQGGLYEVKTCVNDTCTLVPESDLTSQLIQSIQPVTREREHEQEHKNEEEGEWSECSTTCGFGIQHRTKQEGSEKKILETRPCMENNRPNCEIEKLDQVQCTDDNSQCGRTLKSYECVNYSDFFIFMNSNDDHLKQETINFIHNQLITLKIHKYFTHIHVITSADNLESPSISNVISMKSGHPAEIKKIEDTIMSIQTKQTIDSSKISKVLNYVNNHKRPNYYSVLFIVTDNDVNTYFTEEAIFSNTDEESEFSKLRVTFFVNKNIEKTCEHVNKCILGLNTNLETYLNLIKTEFNTNCQPPHNAVCSTWSEWSNCSASCGLGEQKRTRSTLKSAVDSSVGIKGLTCEQFGVQEVRSCNLKTCDVSVASSLIESGLYHFALNRMSFVEFKKASFLNQKESAQVSDSSNSVPSNSVNSSVDESSTSSVYDPSGTISSDHISTNQISSSLSSDVANHFNFLKANIQRVCNKDQLIPGDDPLYYFKRIFLLQTELQEFDNADNQNMQMKANPNGDFLKYAHTCVLFLKETGNTFLKKIVSSFKNNQDSLLQLTNNNVANMEDSFILPREVFYMIKEYLKDDDSWNKFNLNHKTKTSIGPSFISNTFKNIAKFVEVSSFRGNTKFSGKLHSVSTSDNEIASIIDKKKREHGVFVKLIREKDIQTNKEIYFPNNSLISIYDVSFTNYTGFKDYIINKYIEKLYKLTNSTEKRIERDLMYLYTDLSDINNINEAIKTNAQCQTSDKQTSDKQTSGKQTSAIENMIVEEVRTHEEIMKSLETIKNKEKSELEILRSKFNYILNNVKEVENMFDTFNRSVHTFDSIKESDHYQTMMSTVHTHLDAFYKEINANENKPVNAETLQQMKQIIDEIHQLENKYAQDSLEMKKIYSDMKNYEIFMFNFTDANNFQRVNAYVAEKAKTGNEKLDEIRVGYMNYKKKASEFLKLMNITTENLQNATNTMIEEIGNSKTESERLLSELEQMQQQTEQLIKKAKTEKEETETTVINNKSNQLKTSISNSFVQLNSLMETIKHDIEKSKEQKLAIENAYTKSQSLTSESEITAHSSSPSDSSDIDINGIQKVLNHKVPHLLAAHHISILRNLKTKVEELKKQSETLEKQLSEEANTLKKMKKENDRKKTEATNKINQIKTQLAKELAEIDTLKTHMNHRRNAIEDINAFLFDLYIPETHFNENKNNYDIYSDLDTVETMKNEEKKIHENIEQQKRAIDSLEPTIHTELDADVALEHVQKADAALDKLKEEKGKLEKQKQALIEINKNMETSRRNTVLQLLSYYKIKATEQNGELNKLKNTFDVKETSIKKEYEKINEIKQQLEDEKNTNSPQTQNEESFDAFDPTEELQKIIQKERNLKIDYSILKTTYAAAKRGFDNIDSLNKELQVLIKQVNKKEIDVTPYERITLSDDSNVKTFKETFDETAQEIQNIMKEHNYSAQLKGKFEDIDTNIISKLNEEAKHMKINRITLNALKAFNSITARANANKQTIQEKNEMLSSMEKHLSLVKAKATEVNTTGKYRGQYYSILENIAQQLKDIERSKEKLAELTTNTDALMSRTLQLRNSMDSSTSSEMALTRYHGMGEQEKELQKINNDFRTLTEKMDTIYSTIRNIESNYYNKHIGLIWTDIQNELQEAKEKCNNVQTMIQAGEKQINDIKELHKTVRENAPDKETNSTIEDALTQLTTLQTTSLTTKRQQKEEQMSRIENALSTGNMENLKLITEGNNFEDIMSSIIELQKKSNSLLTETKQSNEEMDELRKELEQKVKNYEYAISNNIHEYIKKESLTAQNDMSVINAIYQEIKNLEREGNTSQSAVDTVNPSSQVDTLKNSVEETFNHLKQLETEVDKLKNIINQPNKSVEESKNIRNQIEEKSKTCQSYVDTFAGLKTEIENMKNVLQITNIEGILAVVKTNNENIITKEKNVQKELTEVQSLIRSIETHIETSEKLKTDAEGTQNESEINTKIEGIQGARSDIITQIVNIENRKRHVVNTLLAEIKIHVSNIQQGKQKCDQLVARASQVPTVSRLDSNTIQQIKTINENAIELQRKAIEHFTEIQNTSNTLGSFQDKIDTTLYKTKILLERAKTESNVNLANQKKKQFENEVAEVQKMVEKLNNAFMHFNNSYHYITTSGKLDNIPNMVEEFTTVESLKLEKEQIKNREKNQVELLQNGTQEISNLVISVENERDQAKVADVLYNTYNNVLIQTEKLKNMDTILYNVNKIKEQLGELINSMNNVLERILNSKQKYTSMFIQNAETKVTHHEDEMKTAAEELKSLINRINNFEAKSSLPNAENIISQLNTEVSKTEKILTNVKQLKTHITSIKEKNSNITPKKVALGEEQETMENYKTEVQNKITEVEQQRQALSEVLTNAVQIYNQALLSSAPLIIKEMQNMKETVSTHETEVRDKNETIIALLNTIKESSPSQSITQQVRNVNKAVSEILQISEQTKKINDAVEKKEIFLKSVLNLLYKAQNSDFQTYITQAAEQVKQTAHYNTSILSVVEYTKTQLTTMNDTVKQLKILLKKEEIYTQIQFLKDKSDTLAQKLIGNLKTMFSNESVLEIYKTHFKQNAIITQSLNFFEVEKKKAETEESEINNKLQQIADIQRNAQQEHEKNNTLGCTFEDLTASVSKMETYLSHLEKKYEALEKTENVIISSKNLIDKERIICSRITSENLVIQINQQVGNMETLKMKAEEYAEYVKSNFKHIQDPLETSIQSEEPIQNILLEGKELLDEVETVNGEMERVHEELIEIQNLSKESTAKISSLESSKEVDRVNQMERETEHTANHLKQIENIYLQGNALFKKMKMLKSRELVREANAYYKKATHLHKILYGQISDTNFENKTEDICEHVNYINDKLKEFQSEMIQILSANQERDEENGETREEDSTDLLKETIKHTDVNSQDGTAQHNYSDKKKKTNRNSLEEDLIKINKIKEKMKLFKSNLTQLKSYISAYNERQSVLQQQCLIYGQKAIEVSDEAKQFLFDPDLTFSAETVSKEDSNRLLETINTNVQKYMTDVKRKMKEENNVEKMKTNAKQLQEMSTENYQRNNTQNSASTSTSISTSASTSTSTYTSISAPTEEEHKENEDAIATIYILSKIKLIENEKKLAELEKLTSEFDKTHNVQSLKNQSVKEHDDVKREFYEITNQNEQLDSLIQKIQTKITDEMSRQLSQSEKEEILQSLTDIFNTANKINELSQTWLTTLPTKKEGLENVVQQISNITIEEQSEQNLKTYKQKVKNTLNDLAQDMDNMQEIMKNQAMKVNLNIETLNRLKQQAQELTVKPEQETVQPTQSDMYVMQHDPYSDHRYMEYDELADAKYNTQNDNGEPDNVQQETEKEQTNEKQQNKNKSQKGTYTSSRHVFAGGAVVLIILVSVGSAGFYYSSQKTPKQYVENNDSFFYENSNGLSSSYKGKEEENIEFQDELFDSFVE